MAELKFPTLEEFGRQAGEWALDEFEYKGHTIREWADKITAGEYQPVKHGCWIKTSSPYHFKCSSCGVIANIKLHHHKFCWHCGAKMDEKHEGKSADACFIDEPGNPRYV